MLVFVLNAGSSSLKYQLMNPVTKKSWQVVFVKE